MTPGSPSARVLLRLAVGTSLGVALIVAGFRLIPAFRGTGALTSGSPFGALFLATCFLSIAAEVRDEAELRRLVPTFAVGMAANLALHLALFAAAGVDGAPLAVDGVVAAAFALFATRFARRMVRRNSDGRRGGTR